MLDEIRQDLRARLIRDYHFKERSGWLRYGRCPQCQKKELYAHGDNTWTVKCGRENKCGWTSDIKELYPDAFEGFNKRFKPSRENPNATADAYMDFVRGFPIREIKGFYRQGQFWDPTSDTGTATVIFDIDRKNGIAMERFVEPVWTTRDDGTKEKRKQNFIGSYRGLWWEPPGQEIGKGDELWLVEAVIDAISLFLQGKKVVALLSCYNYPEKKLADLPAGVTLVWALDNDKAGRQRTKLFHKRAEDEGYRSAAAMIPAKGKKKLDWNDAYKDGLLTDVLIDKYRHHGALLIAPTAFEKALLNWNRYARNNFAVEFENKIYWFSLDVDKFNKAFEELHPEHEGTEEELRLKAAKRSGGLEEISNCNFQFLYFQASPAIDEAWYYAKIDFPHGRHSIKNTFTGAQVASSSEFKKRLLSIAPGALFSGKGYQLDWIVRNHLDDIKIVETVDFIGYSKEHEAYVFNDICISKGQVYEINDEDFFEVGSLSLKSLNHSVNLQIGTAEEYDDSWTGHVWDAFGAKGIVAASYFAGSLFAEQIRDTHKSFPFLEIVGQAGAGKSTLIEFLWKLVGRGDYEGFDPNKSTLAGRSRTFSQVSNLPVSLIESDREDSAKAKQFDWDELKTAYNGRISRTRGMKNNSNDTDDSRFRGSILITQNDPVKASEAIMSRIVHLSFDTSEHNDRSKIAADTLAAMPVEQLSYFLRLILQNERKIMTTLKDRMPAYERRLLAMPEINTYRIAKNHAQMMALVEAISDLIGLNTERKNQVLECLRLGAIERQESIAADHPVVSEFWDVYEYLEEATQVNHSKDKNLIAINLNHFQKLAVDANQSLRPLAELKRHLRSSKSRPFRELKTVNSAIFSTTERTSTAKCWVFEKGGQ